MLTSDHSRNFDVTVAEQIARFPDSQFIRNVEAGTISIRHYHTLLTTLFHQTYSGPYTFARAGVNCEWRHEAAKEYLIQHAEEERTHWRWVIDDLASTGYSGPSPRLKPPHPSCQAYVGLNYYVADCAPIARLATAAVLEGIGAAYGGVYGSRLLKALQLSKSQASFFLSHAETDKTHSAELRDVIARCDLTPDEWMWMSHAAEMAGLFYRGMYDHEAYA
jgi:hypothetical protein